MSELNTCPVPDLATYLKMRADQPTAVIPCAGEPVAIREGRKMVWAADGDNNRGWYDYTTDIFHIVDRASGGS